MAEPHSLNTGDVVTHPEWPAGTTRIVEGASPFQRLAFDGRRRRLVDDPVVRIIYLNEPVAVNGEVDDAWMEAGLVLAP
ncbi:hypothetical protein CcrC1_gp064c [Caulobacter phage C1]|nr:hypothetical protein CcrC1_gp064c [Caulobacter phage C1]UTU08291.1 hypothetical protein CcrC2_gp063c [Caulobacter phage C2]UTU08814.1 hypothetical protein CcrJ4_gp063c [Caulobacter phage J4]UTU09366.1 hypothetical protein CcrBL47_gp080c [Caulobacter phage BL47]UTU09926.1 hypothetical protein CcrRB23_gp064c [Caulobacter phage RB23]WGN96951.1 hypothetical protein [Bertelyvirus sp.]